MVLRRSGEEKMGECVMRKQYHRVWDIMAEIIAALYRAGYGDTRKIDSFLSCCTQTRRKLLCKVQRILGEKGVFEGIDDRFLERLINLRGELDENELLLETLIYLDNKMALEPKFFMVHPGDEVSDMIQLNNNEKQTGIIILPKLTCNWSRKRTSRRVKEKSLAFGINKILRHYYCVQCEKLGQYSLRHHIVSSIKRFGEDMEQIRIAVSPVTDRDILRYERYERDGKARIGITGVDVQGDGKSCDLQRRMENIIRAAEKHKADILIFPEMLGHEEVIDRCLYQLAEKSVEDVDGRVELVLLPTQWKAAGIGDTPWKYGKNTNNLYVVYGSSGLLKEKPEPSWIQQKNTPYTEEREESGKQISEVEDIVSDNVIHVLHIEGIGRITFPICADLLNPDYRQILIQQLGSTLILCPSFSKGTNEFIHAIGQGDSFGCHIIWCNSCVTAHMHSEEKYKKGLKENICCAGISGQYHNYNTIKSQIKCNGVCAKDSCLFYIDIPLKGNVGDRRQPMWTHIIA